jgi:Zn ribbon nucleic-acid-binding protein
MGVLHNQIISDVEHVLNKQGLTPEQTAQHVIDLAERLNTYGRALREAHVHDDVQPAIATLTVRITPEALYEIADDLDREGPAFCRTVLTDDGTHIAFLDPPACDECGATEDLTIWSELSSPVTLCPSCEHDARRSGWEPGL